MDADRVIVLALKIKLSALPIRKATRYLLSQKDGYSRTVSRFSTGLPETIQLQMLRRPWFGKLRCCVQHAVEYDYLQQPSVIHADDSKRIQVYSALGTNGAPARSAQGGRCNAARYVLYIRRWLCFPVKSYTGIVDDLCTKRLTRTLPSAD